jgi:hypothetical protein
MKRIALILFVFIYLLPSVGFSINVHWCGNKVNSISIGHLKADVCPCGKKMKRNCCKDFHTFVKLNGSHKASSTLSVNASNLTLASSAGIFEVIPFNNPASSSFHYANYRPPISCGPPLYVSCRTFRI